MFNIFRKAKPKLSDLIPKNFVDIHSHVLPGIDDGAKNIEESLELIEKMKKIGFSKVVCTPHTYPGLYDNTNKTIQKSFNLLRKHKIKLKLDYASEYMLNQSIIEKAEKKSLLTIKENYILVEISFISEPLNLFDIIFHLQINGYYPILAHPERYRYLFHKKSNFHKLKKSGCLFQMNFNSIIGYYGEDVRKISEYLLSQNMVDFIASDIHNKNHINMIVEKKIKLKNININKLEGIFQKSEVFK